MAKVIIPAALVEEHINESCDVSISSFEMDSPEFSFSWTQRTSGTPSFDYDIGVNEDLVLELEDYVDADYHDDVVRSRDHDITMLQLERDRLAGELKTANEQIRQLSSDKAELQLKLGKFTNKKSFWKFW